LGLTIARDVVRAHGGDIQLSESPLGGLRVLVRLPV
jgi:two-component system osmolarity sensor histidine kinase EnvZ